MCIFREFEYTRKASSFVREYLGYGRTLSRLLLRQIEHVPGRILTYLPEDVDEIYAEKFQYGFWMDSARPGAWMFAKVCEHLASAPTALGIIETHADKGAPYIQNFPMRKVYCGEEVYGIILPGDQDDMKMTSIDRGGVSFVSLVCAMTSADEASVLRTPDADIHVDDLCRAADRVAGFIVRAYDGEGFVIWEKNR